MSDADPVNETETEVAARARLIADEVLERVGLGFPNVATILGGAGVADEIRAGIVVHLEKLLERDRPRGVATGYRIVLTSRQRAGVIVHKVIQRLHRGVGLMILSIEDLEEEFRAQALDEVENEIDAQVAQGAGTIEVAPADPSTASQRAQALINAVVELAAAGQHDGWTFEAFLREEVQDLVENALDDHAVAEIAARMTVHLEATITPGEAKT